jgi:hypothetical protein
MPFDVSFDAGGVKKAKTAPQKKAAPTLTNRPGTVRAASVSSVKAS